MTPNTSKIFAVPAFVIALGLTCAGDAVASAYAFARDDVFNFDLSIIDTTSGSVSLVNFATISESSATHGSYPGQAFAHPTDAPRSLAGSPEPGQNNFGQVGRTGDYNRGDALISNASVQSGSGAANNVAEGFSPDKHFGTGFGANTLTGEFTLVDTGTVSFSFDAIPYMEVQVAGGHLGGFATASLGFVISIEDQLTNTTVFSWAPDGISGNQGNDLEADNVDASLNEAITAHLGELLFHNVSLDTFSYSNFVDLGPGTYNLSVAMTERVSQRGVPVPASLYLLGVGLLGVGRLRRIRRN